MSMTVPQEKDNICDKLPRKEFISIMVFDYFKKKVPHQITDITVFITSKTKRSESVIILTEMVFGKISRVL